MKTLLVTGGAGFIGSNFIRYWLKKHPEDEIVNLDLLTYAGNESNLYFGETAARHRLVQGDIRDRKLISSLVAEADVVVHFAAESHVDRSIVGPDAFVETNVKGTFELLEAARRLNTRFHHISTDEVYGALSLDSTDKFSEVTPYQPNSPYSATKAASDHLVRAYHVTYGVPVTITNCSNNFGPYQHPEKFIARMITNLIEGGGIRMYGDGKYVRDWLFVEDHCRAIEVVLKNGAIGDTYVVGGLQEDISNLEVAHMLLDIFELGEEKIELVKDRPGHDRRYAVDWSKINNELAWEPQHDFKEWLVQTVQWYRNNEEWWKPLKEEAEQLYRQTGQ